MTTTPFSNQAMSENEITIVLQDAIKRGASMVVRMITATKMRTKNNPFVNDCFKDSTSIYVSGVSYQNMVNGALKREGAATDFVAEKASGMVHDDNINVIMASDDGTKHYISLCQYAGTQRKTRYIHTDGRAFTEYELGVLQQFLPTPNTSKKQAAAGLSEEKQIICIRPDVKNIMSIRQGTEIELTRVETQQVLC